MQLDVITIAVIESLIIFLQVIALAIQSRINRHDRAIFWWLIGSIFWAVGVILMPLVTIKSLEILAALANPLVIIGFMCLYIGITRFQEKRENRRVLGLILGLFLCSYYYFIFQANAISSRSFICTSTTALMSFMCVWQLISSKENSKRISIRFTASIFFIYGVFTLFRMVMGLLSPPILFYTDVGILLPLAFIFAMACNFLWTFGFVMMVNQRLNAEMHEEKENLQLIFHTSPDAAVISRLTDGVIVEINSGYMSLSGYSREELIGNSTLKVNLWSTPADREIFIEILTKNGFCENLEFNFQRKDGNIFTGSISAKILTIRSVPHIISVVHDITSSKRAEEALRESEELYRSILNASPDDITITDMQGRIQVISPAAKIIFGYGPDYDGFLGAGLLDYVIPEDHERAKLNIQKMVTGIHAGPNEYQGVRKDGSLLNIEVKSGLIHDAKGLPSKMVFIVRDVTERKQTEIQIRRLVQQLEIEKKAAQQNANTDSLTGLANRRYFDEVLQKEIRRLKRSGLPLSMLMLDVDYFKHFNDTYGHLAGDNCLKQIGTTLKSMVSRVTDLPARFGGEEFVVILTETDAFGAGILAERIRLAVEALAIPHSGSDVAGCVTISQGVVTLHPDALASPEQIIALADDSLYRAKNEGRNRIAVASLETIQKLTSLVT